MTTIAGAMVAALIFVAIVAVLAGWLKDELEKPDPYEEKDE